MNVFKEINNLNTIKAKYNWDFFPKEEKGSIVTVNVTTSSTTTTTN